MENRKISVFLTKKLVLLIAVCSLLCIFFVPVQASEEYGGSAGLERPEIIDVPTIDSSQIYNRKDSTCYSSKWDKYSTYYYYNQMDDNEKSFYDKLNSMCLYYLESNEDITDTIEGIPVTEYVSCSGMTTDEAINIAIIFYYSNPQYYFLSGDFGSHPYRDEVYVSLGLFNTFADGDARKTTTTQLENKITQWMSKIDDSATVVEKEQEIHNLIISNTTYVRGTYDQSVYSVFFENETVCTGYAKTFELLCNGLGIDTVLVTSDNHAWNKVRIEGCWYEVDCTWDDPDEADLLYFAYLNRSKSKFLSLDSSGSHIQEDLWRGYGPSCLVDSGATYIKYGTITSPVNAVENPSINMSPSGTDFQATITCDTSDAVMYYTLDGKTPSEAGSKAYQYSGAITVKDGQILKVVAVYNTFRDSAIVSNQAITYPESAGTPVIATQPVSKAYTYGKSVTPLKVAVSYVDMSVVSYQWYVKTSATGKATLIKGATKSTYTPPANTIGTKYYYCMVTNYDSTATKNKTVKKQSNTAKITINPIAFSSAKVTGVKAKTYTGKSLTQSITVTCSGKKLVYNKDYTVSYSNNKSVGVAKCTVKGKGFYSGQKSFSFVINAPKTSITYKNAGSKKVSIKWSKKSGITGYQIQYSYSSAFSSAKTVTVKGASSKSYTIKKLKTKKYCYIRVRTYKIVSGKKYYSSWSSKVKIKVK